MTWSASWTKRARFVFPTKLGAFADAPGRTLSLPEALDAIAKSGDFIVLSMESACLRPGVLDARFTSGPRPSCCVITWMASR
ncbi:MAG: hypothetical protein JNK59_05975, partial [Sterolibacteriaceae bacterium]|nr:hypothetical protein [Sterolibacteriaceae bacterium]